MTFLFHLWVQLLALLHATVFNAKVPLNWHLCSRSPELVYGELQRIMHILTHVIMCNINNMYDNA